MVSSVTITIDHLEAWMQATEDEHLEFKEAKKRFASEDLARYCCALANESGGHLILGVTNKRPRIVVGSSACPDLGRAKGDIYRDLGIRIEVWEVAHPAGRVVIIEVPSLLPGMPVSYKGSYLMRVGEDLVPMDNDKLRSLLSTGQPVVDFSAQFCTGATIADLNPDAIERFRILWQKKSGLISLEHIGHEQLLIDAELVSDGRITYAALLLFGTKEALGKHLAQAEVIFEYRNSDALLPSQQRVEFRQGFLAFQDELWDLINQRNDSIPYQEGFIVRPIPTFHEGVVREAILNAICHRDYRHNIESTFVRQFPAKLEIVSPGGFPPGVTEENILSKQVPRNRRLAEALTKCGFVERAGQGVDLMFKETIREGKLPPDYGGTDGYRVFLTLRGEIRDPGFLRFLERTAEEIQTSFTTEDFVILDLIHREQTIPAQLQPRLQRLRELGIIEAQGRGRGIRYFLSRRFYSFVGQPGAYTRRRGLDRETNKALLLRHIESNNNRGCRLSELQQVLPGLNRQAIQRLLTDLRADKTIHVEGRTRAALWYPGPDPEDAKLGNNDAI